ncbi:MAG: transketolase [Terracidiphilus sp.]
MRRIILTHSKLANVGHIGCCLCVVEILAAIYGNVLRATSPHDPERDRFVLSKGHAALALYAALAVKGWIPYSELDRFCCDGSSIAVHPEHVVPGVDFSTGSLGQGISMAVGAALAAQLEGSPRRVYCLISDAECNEGSTWEAAMFAAQHRLGNLQVVMDWNRQQAMGRCEEIIDMPNMEERWRTFGWTVSEVDGHSIPQLAEAMATHRENSPSSPHLILARTVFGCGVSYMEKGVPVTQANLSVQPINWHYLPMSDQEFEIAMRELETAVEKSIY